MELPMKKHIILLILFLQAQLLYSQAPVVSNVSFQQRTDGSLIVDIYYDLSDTDGETKKIEVEASDDNGSTWDLTCSSLTGDVGTGIALGTDKHIVWDFYADNPNQSGSQYKVRVTASEVGTMTGNDGKVYQTVKIGNQWWMAENLKETQYRNDDAILEVTDSETWAVLSAGARCAYNNSESTANTYGYLYNWYAVDDSRNIAPEGWHVPTDEEWKQLEMYLCMSQSVADMSGWRGTDESGKMKESGIEHWNSPNTGATNESGFTALPGGYHYPTVYFNWMGTDAYFWSSTEYINVGNAWYRRLHYTHQNICRDQGLKQGGFSVRCVKD